ncbi:MAG: glutamate 5-kinase, partial [Propylenella sp.]
MKAKSIAAHRCIVVKVGSSLLIDASGQLDRLWLAALVDDIAALVKGKRRVLVVSSG